MEEHRGKGCDCDEINLASDILISSYQHEGFFDRNVRTRRFTIALLVKTEDYRQAIRYRCSRSEVLTFTRKLMGCVLTNFFH